MIDKFKLSISLDGFFMHIYSIHTKINLAIKIIKPTFHNLEIWVFESVFNIFLYNGFYERLRFTTLIPPELSITLPVTKSASSSQKKSIILAISPPEPGRPIGVTSSLTDFAV